MRFDLDDESIDIISQALSPDINQEEEDIGWEEITYANITYLIKSIISGGQAKNDVKIHYLEDYSKL